jgi:hypothetical protein
VLSESKRGFLRVKYCWKIALEFKVSSPAIRMERSHVKSKKN